MNVFCCWKNAKYWAIIYAYSFQYINSAAATSWLTCHFFISHLHKDCPLIDKKLEGREVPKYHVHDKKEEGSSPVVEIERMMWLFIDHILRQQDCHIDSWDFLHNCTSSKYNIFMMH